MFPGSSWVPASLATPSYTGLRQRFFRTEDRSAVGVNARQGKFEAAGRGTLFLDEVADLSPAVQGKLLCAVHDLAVERVGGTTCGRSISGWWWARTRVCASWLMQVNLAKTCMTGCWCRAAGPIAPAAETAPGHRAGRLLACCLLGGVPISVASRGPAALHGDLTCRRCATAFPVYSTFTWAAGTGWGGRHVLHGDHGRSNPFAIHKL